MKKVKVSDIISHLELLLNSPHPVHQGALLGSLCVPKGNLVHVQMCAPEQLPVGPCMCVLEEGGVDLGDCVPDGVRVPVCAPEYVCAHLHAHVDSCGPQTVLADEHVFLSPLHHPPPRLRKPQR